MDRRMFMALRPFRRPMRIALDFIYRVPFLRSLGKRVGRMLPRRAYVGIFEFSAGERPPAPPEQPRAIAAVAPVSEKAVWVLQELQRRALSSAVLPDRLK